MEEYKVLAMNFGSTSTKVAVYEGDTCLLQQVFHHSPKDLEGVSSMEENAALRKPLILSYLAQQGVNMEEFDAIVGRGGLVRPLLGGTYAVNERMSELAKLSGCPDFPRRPRFHALNQKAIAKRYAAEYGLNYDALRLIVTHMGGGVTVGVHLNGRVVDVNNGLEGEGAYTAERPGTIAVLDVLRAAFSGKYGTTFQELREFFTFHCGLAAYAGTNDGREVSRRIKEGDKQAELAYRGMAYQIAKEIGAAGAVLQGKVDAILLTGGFAYDSMLMGWIKESVDYLAPVYIYPGEDEMLSLAQGAIRVLKGQEEVLEY